MGQQSATLLLLLYILLPVGVSYVRGMRALVAQTILCQIKAINITRQLEKRLTSSVALDEGLTLLVFWLKWHRVIQSSLSLNAAKFDLWFTSLIYLKYSIYGRSQVFKEFLLASWFDPGNATAYTYLGLFTSCPVFLSHENGDRIMDNGFTIVGQANPNVIILCKIDVRLTILNGLVSVSQKENLLETQVQTNDNGYFEVDVPVSLTRRSGTRYIVFAIESGDLEMTTGTQITLIQQ